MTLTPETTAELQAIAQTKRLTDVGNARRFAEQHAGAFRYVYGLGWHQYDGKRWAPDKGASIEAAKETARSIYAEAAKADDPKATAKWAACSEAAPRLKAMLSLAQSEVEIACCGDDLNVDPYLLNVENGTLDLKTGRLRAHDPNDMISRLAPVAYKPDASDEKLDDFLLTVFRDHGEEAGRLVLYLQRAIGYALTGSTSEEKLFFVHGPEATGKSTLVEALKAMLGDYAATADFETFLARRGDAGVRNDIARLAGARLVGSLEVDEGKKLAEGLIKSLTGKDKITARFLFTEAFEFQPQFKLVLAANARPRVNANDGAMWRRIDCIPFTNTIPEDKRDAKVKDHLLADPEARSALLAWAVQGCQNWQREGLATPDAVKAYTEEYRQESDIIGEWIGACCERNKHVAATSAELHASYAPWVESRREKPLGAKNFTKALRDHGLQDDHGRNGTVWYGITLR